MSAFASFYIFLAIIFSAGLIYLWLSGFLAHKIRHSKKSVILGVQISRLPNAQTLASNMTKTAEFLKTFQGFRYPIAFEILAPHMGSKLHFHINIPMKALKFVKFRLQEIWPDIVMSNEENVSIFYGSSEAKAATIVKNVNSVNNLIKLDAESTPLFLGIFEMLLSNRGVGEGNALQIIIKPVFRKNRIMAKSSSQYFQTNIRLISVSSSNWGAENALKSISDYFRKFRFEAAQSFTITKQKNAGKLMHQFSFQEFDNTQASIFSKEELAMLLPFGS
jgi:hypothetical protein